ncbi:MAG: hypothetical protein ACRELD_02085 [Longimicrobiales bacterium]
MGAEAQLAGSNAATVQVDVASGLSVTTMTDLSFGTVVQSAGAVTLTNTSAGIGKFRINGQQNRNVQVTLLAPAVLTSGANAIVYAPAAGYNQTADQPSALTGTFTFVGGVSTATMQLADKSPPGAAGQAFVYIYGGIDVGAVPAGTYVGQFTMTAAY